MEDLIIQATRKSPEILMSADGRIKISGRCIPEEPDEFFKPANEWIDSYCLNPAEETVVDMCIEYTSATNAGKMFTILKKLKQAAEEGRKLTVNFYFETDDEQMHDMGNYWKDLLNLNLKLIEVEQLNLPPMK